MTPLGLVPDVPLFVGDGFTSDVAWQIADGVVRPPADLAQEYAPGSWLPSVMRAPTTEELARYATTQAPTTRHGFVGVVAVDPEAAATLRAYHEGARQGHLDEAAGVDALKRILIAASRRIVIEGSVETRQPTIDPPRQLTVSRRRTGDRRRALRVGMHVDHWTASALTSRLDAANRFSINLGPGDRWLLYIPYSVPLLMAHVPGISPDDTRELLARLGSELPVLRLRVPPDHAYLAPAEAVFHDASTLDATAPAMKQSLLGHFRPRVATS